MNAAESFDATPLAQIGLEPAVVEAFDVAGVHTAGGLDQLFSQGTVEQIAHVTGLATRQVVKCWGLLQTAHKGAKARQSHHREGVRR
jgi:hypothetical protein